MKEVSVEILNLEKAEVKLEGISELGECDCWGEFERGNVFGSFFLRWNIITSFFLFCFCSLLWLGFLTGFPYLF